MFVQLVLADSTVQCQHLSKEQPSGLMYAPWKNGLAKKRDIKASFVWPLMPNPR